MRTHHSYVKQAATYDRTRHASPSIVAPLLDGIGSVRGAAALDTGGGTGNYAAALREAGFIVLVADISAEMLRSAAAKDLPVVLADAADLPVASRSIDVVTMISMLHLVPGWRTALDEAKRVLRRGGRLAVMLYTREHLDVHWVVSYFPSSRDRLYAEHQPIAEVLDALPGARAVPFWFSDLVDGSMAAMCRYPSTVLDGDLRGQTSFFERLERDNPDGLDAGLHAIARDLEDGRRPHEEVGRLRDEIGDGTLVFWDA